MALGRHGTLTYPTLNPKPNWSLPLQRFTQFCVSDPGGLVYTPLHSHPPLELGVGVGGCHLPVPQPCAPSMGHTHWGLPPPRQHHQGVPEGTPGLLEGGCD